jgi:UDP-glucose 4-epimerase
LIYTVLFLETDTQLLRSGTGYIGSFTALALLEAGYKVVVADNLDNSSEEALNRIELICGKRPEFAKVDITNEADFDKVFVAHPDIDSVIHFAALKVRLSPPALTYMELMAVPLPAKSPL